MKNFLLSFLTLLCCLAQHAFAGNIVIIGNSNVPKIDTATVLKIYTGKIISVSGSNLTAVNLKPGSQARNRFLQDFLSQDEEKYTAYWTVRRYIGKGAPPAELATTSEVINFVQSTPGAVGYVDEDDLKASANINVIARR
jgi:ABC-type phosphate transport system substrate-binding protein